MYHDDTIYHIYNRGAHRSNIFLTDYHYKYLLQLMDRYRQQYHVEMYAYCLMPNHYHFLMRQRAGTSLSRFLQTTFNAYTQAFNKMESHSGTIFEGAAKRITVEDDSYLVQLIGYIHYNPVAAGLSQAPEMWVHSDCREWLGEIPFRFDGKLLQQQYFQDKQGYRDFLDSYQQEKVQQNISKYLLEE
jgi:putative transposase